MLILLTASDCRTDGSLQINSLASKIVSAIKRNVFQNGTNALSKMGNIFVKQDQNFACLDHIIVFEFYAEKVSNKGLKK